MVKLPSPRPSPCGDLGVTLAEVRECPLPRRRPLRNEILRKVWYSLSLGRPLHNPRHSADVPSPSTGEGESLPRTRFSVSSAGRVPSTTASSAQACRWARLQGAMHLSDKLTGRGGTISFAGLGFAVVRIGRRGSGAPSSSCGDAFAGVWGRLLTSALESAQGPRCGFDVLCAHHSRNDGDAVCACR